jgi:hypothetical protein
MAHTGGFYKQTKKNINMKQLLSLFLFLLPCLAWAQYPSNGNQKITLGEQTTADGLIFRGVASIDTVTATSKITRANKQDTSAFLLLDTVTNLLWHYKIGSNAWSQAGGSTLDTATMLLPYYRSGRTGIIQSSDVPTLNQNTTGSAATLTTSRTFQTNLASTSTASFNGSANVTPGVTGTLPVANGGTGSATKNFVALSTADTITAQKVFNATIKSRITGEQILYADNGGTNRMYMQLQNTSATFYAGIQGVTANDLLLDVPAYSGVFYTNNQDMAFGTNFTRRLMIKSDGKVGIETSSPSEAFHVVGNGRFTAVGAGAYSNDLNITSTGVLTTASSSDETFKYNINPIAYGLSTILQLKPVSFQWKKGDEHDLGFIAQDAVNIIPEAVDTFWDSSLLFRSNTIIPILTKAIQEQQALIKALEQRIINLENK